MFIPRNTQPDPQPQSPSTYPYSYPPRLRFVSLFIMAYFPSPAPYPHPPVPSDLYVFCTTFGFLDQTSVVFDLTQVIVYPSILTCNTMTHVARSLQYKHNTDVRCVVRRTRISSLSHYLSLTHTLACSPAHTIAQSLFTSLHLISVSLTLGSGIVTWTDLLGEKVYDCCRCRHPTPHCLHDHPLPCACPGPPIGSVRAGFPSSVHSSIHP